MIISPSALLCIRNVSHTRCREYQNTVCVQKLSSENRTVYENMEKYGRDIQAADDNKAHAFCILDT